MLRVLADIVQKFKLGENALLIPTFWVISQFGP